MKAMQTPVATDRREKLLQELPSHADPCPTPEDWFYGIHEALVIVPIAQLLQLNRRHRHENMLRSIISS